MSQTDPNSKKSRRDHTNEPPKRINLRADAAWVLYQILECGQSATPLLSKVWARHEKPSDRAWLQETIYGCLRTLPQLQIWLRSLLDKPIQKKQKISEHLIMVGFYQLAFLRTADHAAVSETVKANKILRNDPLNGLVNAVLRRFQREQYDLKRSDEPHVKLGLSKWLYKRLLIAYPEALNSIAKGMHERAPIWLRINPLKTNIEDFCKSLSDAGYQYHQQNERCLKLTNPGDITQIPGFDTGKFAIQDFAAQQASNLLNVQAGDKVLDCCCAPGGKTSALLESESELAEMYAVDSDKERLNLVRENLQRLGHEQKFAQKLSLVCADASMLDAHEVFQSKASYFDKILLDAPCSATGVIRRHPDIMWLRKPSDIEALTTLQSAILEQCWHLLKPGGTMLYATCSILPEENSTQISAFLARHSDARTIPIQDNDGQFAESWQILPGENGMDGFFYARIEKVER